MRIGPGTPVTLAPAPASDDARLKKSALQMEGLFVQRLFAAMRDTIPDDGLVSQSNGESTFTSLLDEKMAEQVPTQWNGEHSLANALYKQLRQNLGQKP
jgi:flagellar protein FlgJ